MAEYLTADQQSLETSDAWSGSAVVQSRASDQAYSGTWSCKAVVDAVPANARWYLNSAATGITVGSTYSISAQVRTDQTGRQIRFEIDWLTSTDGYISTWIGSDQSLTQNAWTQITGTTTAAPATAAKARLILKIAGTPVAGHTYWSDAHSIADPITIPTAVITHRVHVGYTP